MTRLAPALLVLGAAACGGAVDGASVTVKGHVLKVTLVTTEQARRWAPRDFPPPGESSAHLFAWPRERFLKLESERGPTCDVLFLDRAGRVVETGGLRRDDPEGLVPKAEAAMALLVGQGLVEKWGVRAGDAVELSKEVRAAKPEELPLMKIGDVEARVELALSDEDKSHGLMFRPRMSADDGMLFAYDADAHRSFWMKNTLIPLDIAFFRSDGTFVNVVETPTAKDPRRDTPPTAAGEAPVRYVLEMNLGWFRKKGLVDAEGKARPGLKALFPPEAVRGRY
jgi:hypothetical protein